MKRWTHIWLALLTALALAAAACGSDSTTTTSVSGASDGDVMDDEAIDDEAMDDEAMDDMDDDDEDDDEVHDDEDHNDHDDEDGTDHDHAKLLDVAVGSPSPGVAITVDDGLTLYVSLENFTITPENVDGEPVENEGHMHLLVDGVKVDRFYELERDLAEVLEPGMHAVEVELNANDHRAWAVDGDRISDTVMVEVAGEADDADIVISASYANGSVEIDEDRVDVPLGSDVLIEISSDVAEEVHVHGYDVLADIGADNPGLLRFTANVPGTFEVELEQSGTFIVELVVS